MNIQQKNTLKNLFMLFPKDYSMNIFLVRVKMFLNNLNVLLKLSFTLFSESVGLSRFGAKRFIS